jgi:hypothetical protein
MRIQAAILAPCLLLLASNAAAAPPTKDECVEAHGRTQDMREKGRLSDAKRYAIVCAQSACPALVQADCARFTDELTRTVPSLVFAARDGRGVDLTDTQVYLDGVLVESRIEGTPQDVDPGKHTVRFVHAGKEVTQAVVVSPGERDRPIVATFGEPQATAGAGGGPAPDAESSKPSRPIFPLIIAGVGVIAAGVGGFLFFNGLAKVPDNCSRSNHTCAAPPGDSSFDTASSAMSQSNVGLGVGIAGLVVAAGGIVWYLTSSPTEPEKARAAVFWPGGAQVRF